MGGNCAYKVDGVYVSADYFYSILQFTAQCPNNNCSGLFARVGPGGTSIFQQWVPWYERGYNILGEDGTLLESSATVYWHWATVGTASGTSDAGTIWNTVRAVFDITSS